MTYFGTAAARIVGMLALMLASASPALAATYAIGLYEGSTTTGAGSFTFTNPGTAGSTGVSMTSLATNASSTVKAISWSGNGASVIVQAVKFSGTTGNYVEGLSGSLSVNGPFPVSTAVPAGICDGSGNSSGCDATITFSYTACSPASPGSCDPGSAAKAYTIVVKKTKDYNGFQCSSASPCTVATVTGTYSLRNTASAIPEPGTLLLVGLALALLGWRLRKRGFGGSA